MNVSGVSRVKSVGTCLVLTTMLTIAGCETTGGGGALTIVDTSVAFFRDFLLNVLAAVLL
jgi:hypothetical protein